MEPPCISFHPENGLGVGLPLIHSAFCLWLNGLYVRIRASQQRRLEGKRRGVLSSYDSSDIPVVTHHQQGDYMTTEMPYKPNDYTLHPMSMSVLGVMNDLLD